MATRPALSLATTALTDLQQAYLVGRRDGPGLSGVEAMIWLDLRVIDEVVDADLLRLRLPAAMQAVLETTPALTRQLAPEGRSCQRGEATVRTRSLEGGIRVDAGPLSVQLGQSGGSSRLIVRAEQIHLDLPSLLAVLDQVLACVAGEEAIPRPLGVPDLSGQEESRVRWQQRVGRLPTTRPELPQLRTPDELGAPRFEHLLHRLPTETWERAQLAARGQGLDPADLPFIAFAEAVRAFSRTPFFCLTEAHRDDMVRAEAGIGQAMVTSLVPVLGRDDQCFGDRARELAGELTLSRELSDWSAVRVLRELRTEAAEVSSAVVFTDLLRGGERTDLAWGRLEGVQVQTPHVACGCLAMQTGGELLLGWHHVLGLFPPGVLVAMADSVTGLLRRVADDPKVWAAHGQVVDLPLTDVIEQAAANDTQAPIPAVRLHDHFLERATEQPERTAVIDRTGSVSYGELAEQARRIAGGIRSARQIEPGTLVAVMTPPGRDQVAALLGVLLAGGAYVVIDPGLPNERRAELLDRCKVTVVVTPEELAVTLGLDGLDVVDPVSAGPALQEPAATTAEDLAYVIFTSGSTGVPKGVMVRHHSAANTVQDVVARHGVGPTDGVLALAPAGFDLSVFDIFGLLGAGGVVVVPDPTRAQDPEHWVELLRTHHVTIWNTVPAPMRLLVDALDEDTESLPLRTVLLSGDWIPLDLPDRIRARLPEAELISMGGATEGSIWSISHHIGELQPGWTSVPYGTAMSNQRMTVLNTWGEPCPRWVTGEIHIGGAGVADGYWRDPEQTQQRFIRHPRTGERLYRTGDLGRFRSGGVIEILGREDAQVKINGYRVELGEIEAALQRADVVDQVVVQAPEHPATGQRQVVAYVVPVDTAVQVEETVRRVASAHLPSYMTPSSVVLIERVPLTPNGKVAYAALPEPWARSQRHSPAAPDEQLVDQVQQIWARRLGYDEFGVEDGYFDLGGDSLHAVAILRGLREAFGLDEAVEADLMETLFLNGSVRDVVEIIREAR